MKKAALIGIVAGLVALGGCGAYRLLFPDDEARIREMLGELSAAASVGRSEKPLSQMARAAELAGFFTEDVEIHAKGPGGGVRSIVGRPRLQQIAVSAQSMGGGLSVSFKDAIVDLGNEKGRARCRLTAIANQGAESGPWVQILLLDLRESDGDWKVARVETVDTVERIE